MKLLSIINTQVTRYIMLNYPVGGVYIPELIKFIKERYQFVGFPNSLDEWNPTKGATFLQGLINSINSNKIVIDKLQIYTEGLLVNSMSYTEDVDFFIDDFIRATANTFNFTSTPCQEIKKGYISEIEVELNTKISHFFSKPINHLCAEISHLNDGLEDDKMEFEVFSIQIRPKNIIKYKEYMPFSLQKREGTTPDSNIYYSSAPLSTKAHLDALKALEN